MSHSQNGYHQKGYKQQTANAAVVVEKREPSCAGSENVNWYSHYGEKYGSFLKKLKIELPYAGIPLLGIYLKKTLIWEETCTPVFIATLLTRVKTWKQPKCPLTDKWIKKVWCVCICTMEYYSATIKKEIMPFAATSIDLEIIILSEVSQTEKHKYHMIFLICRN